MKSFLILLTLGVPLLGAAQTVQPQAAAAVAPAVPVPPVLYTPMAPAGASGLVSERDDWKAVNDSVGQYRRGHIDILKAEKARRPDAPATPSPQGPSR